MMAPPNMLSPPGEIFYWPFQGGTSFCGSFLLFVFHVCHAVLSVPSGLVVTCWERADLLALLCVVFSCVFVTFPYGFLGQVWWYLIVLILDLCLLPYFYSVFWLRTCIYSTMEQLYEPHHEISNNVVCATSIDSDQPAHTRSLIRAFASRLNILWI